MKILFTIFTTLILLCYTACNNEIPVENGLLNDTITNYLPDTIIGKVKIKYEYLATSPTYVQTTMLTGYNNKLYRIGSRWPIHVLDLSTNTWDFIHLPDSSYWRWDGAAVTINDSIFIVATYYGSYCDIIILDASKNTFAHSNVNLPQGFSYPAYCTYNDKILFLCTKYDSVFEYNTSNRELRVVAENPFKSSRNYNGILASGKNSNYFYVFGGYLNQHRTNKFYRLNLSNYTWERIWMPVHLEQKFSFGASYDEQFILFSDSVTTHLYSFIDKKWYLDSSEVPIYPRTLSGNLMLGEWSFSGNDSCLYGTDVYDKKIWKIKE